MRDMEYDTVTVDLQVPRLAVEATVDPAMTALLVVDLQNISCNPQSDSYAGDEAEEALHNSAAFVDRARAEGIRVLWLQSVRTPDRAEFSVWGRKPYRIDGTWEADIAPPLKPASDEPIFKKHSHDCFNNTDFEPYLKRNGIVGPVWTFIVVGVAFHGCVLYAVQGLSIRGYRVLVPMDCVYPRTGVHAASTLHRLGRGSYPYTVTPLVGADSIRVQRRQDPRG